MFSRMPLHHRVPARAAHPVPSAAAIPHPATLMRRATGAAAALEATTVLSLQRTLGNQAVRSLLAARSHEIAGPREPEFHYQAVPAESIEGFPKVLGITSLTHKPAVPVLRTHSVGLEGSVEVKSTVTVEGIDASYDSEQNESMGAASGLSLFGMARKQNGQWTGDILPFVTGRKQISWAPSGESERWEEPPDGVYKLFIGISVDDADRIERFEKEHRDDFAYAWLLTLGLLRRLAERFRWAPGDAGESVIARFVDRLISYGARWLIPASPERIESWGPHVRAQFFDLAGQSTRRDNTGQHSPTDYVIVWSPGELLLGFVMGDFSRSSNFIKVTDLETPFTASSYQAYKARPVTRASLREPGTAVTVKRNIPFDAYEKPDKKSTSYGNRHDVAAGAKELAIVERAEGSGQVWLKIRAKGDITYFGDWAYILVNTADLEAK